MQLINALSLTSSIHAWLAKTRHPRILHIFDRACNLINERKEILSIVTSQIGNGPFNLVVEDVLFVDHLSLETPISNFPTHLQLGDLTINTANANLWNPHPDWESLHAKREDIANRLTKLPVTNENSFLPHSLVSSLFSSLVIADLPSSLTAAKQLAGLGAGLTPAGDDFLMGAMYAAWIIHPQRIAGNLAKEVANTAAPLTTSLSAAWLRSAGKGEAGILWHQFFDALSHSLSNLQCPIDRLLSVGHTSGADALVGFVGLFSYWGQPYSNL